MDRRAPLKAGDTVVVLGAGLAGLSAADVLCRRGVRCVVLEKQGQIGGLAATRRCGGFRFDYGPHRFHTSNDGILQRVTGLLGGDLLRLERMSRIRLLDRYFVYPLSLPDVLRRMPPASGAAMLGSYALARIRSALRGPDDASFETWVVDRFGRRLYDIYFGPYTEKLWGMPPSSMSSDWASQRISVPSLAGLVRATLAPGGREIRSLVSLFHYPRGGIGRIADALAGRITGGGGTVITDSPPESVEASPRGGFTVRTSSGTLEAAGVINTIPLPEFAGLLGPALPDGIREAAAGLRFRAVVFVTLKLVGRPAARDHWIYTPEPRYGFNRLSIPENFDPTASDEGGQVVFEFTCDENDALWHGGTGLEAACVEGGARLGLFERDEVMGSTVARQAHAYPVYALGYDRRSAAVLDAVERIPGIVTCGRQGLFRYNNMDHSLEMGDYAARELLGEGSVRERFNWTRSTWADG